MIDDIDHFNITNRVLLSRDADNRPWVLVEGPKDIKFYRRFFNEDKCNLECASGKGNCIKAIIELARYNVNDVLAIVDADYWHTEGYEIPSPNLVVTDTHDLETLLLKSKALEKTLETYCRREYLSEIPNIRDKIVNMGLPLGILRWFSISKTNDITIDFKKINYNEFVDLDRMETVIDSLIMVIVRKVSNSNLDREIIMEYFDYYQSIANNHDPWHVCSGHDLVAILFIWVKKKVGDSHAKALNFDTFDLTLLATYEDQDFYNTEMYKSIKKWVRERGLEAILT